MNQLQIVYIYIKLFRVNDTKLLSTLGLSLFQGRFWGGDNRGQCPCYSESGPPVAPDMMSASIIQWQIFCNDFALKGKVEINCLSSLLPNQNCWNCKYCFKSHLSLVWMRDLSFFSWGVLAPPAQKSRPQPGPPIKTGLEPPLPCSQLAMCWQIMATCVIKTEITDTTTELWYYSQSLRTMWNVPF